MFKSYRILYSRLLYCGSVGAFNKCNKEKSISITLSSKDVQRCWDLRLRSEKTWLSQSTYACIRVLKPKHENSW